MKKSIGISIAAIAIVSLMSGCSENESTTPTSSAWGDRAQDSPTIKKDFKFMSDFRAALEGNGVSCEDYVKRDELMVKDAGNCNFNGVTISLTLFPTTEAGNQVYDAVKSLMNGYLITSNKWWVSTEDEETAKLLEINLGISVL